jgi:hypothetical protein
MLYLFELMANATIEHGLSHLDRGTQFVPRRCVWNGGSFVAFRVDNNGDLKNGPTRPGTLGQANAKA